jgi:hypothetical protein
MPAAGAAVSPSSAANDEIKVLARAVIDLESCASGRTGDVYLALTHGHARLLALTTALDHGRALRSISATVFLIVILKSP